MPPKTSEQVRSTDDKSIAVAAPELRKIVYQSHPYSWKKLLSSPEVFLSLVCVFCSTYFLVQHPSQASYSQLFEYCKKKSDFHLQSREQELSKPEPSSLPTDCVISVMAWLSMCFFLSACCRVVLKAERKHSKAMLEESLQCNFNEDLRKEYVKANEKVVADRNAAREKKHLKPLKPFINSSHIVGDDVVINLMIIMCLIFAFLIIYFVLFGNLNQVRGFGIIISYSILVAGITAPKIFDNILTLQHCVGVIQNICCLALMMLCYLAATNQR